MTKKWSSTANQDGTKRHASKKSRRGSKDELMNWLVGEQGKYHCPLMQDCQQQAAEIGSLMSEIDHLKKHYTRYAEATANEIRELQARLKKRKDVP